MQVTVELDESRYKEALEQELKELPSEVIQELTKEAIRKQLEETNAIKNLLFYERSAYGYYNTRELVPSTFLMEQIQQIDLSDAIADFKKTAIDYLMNNADKLIKEAFFTAVGNFMQLSINNAVKEGIRNHFKH